MNNQSRSVCFSDVPGAACLLFLGNLCAIVFLSEKQTG